MPPPSEDPPFGQLLLPPLPASSAIIIMVLSVPVTLPPSDLSLMMSSMMSSSLKISPLSVICTLYAAKCARVHVLYFIYDSKRGQYIRKGKAHHPARPALGSARRKVSPLARRTLGYRRGVRRTRRHGAASHSFRPFCVRNVRKRYVRAYRRQSDHAFPSVAYVTLRGHSQMPQTGQSRVLLARLRGRVGAYAARHQAGKRGRGVIELLFLYRIFGFSHMRQMTQTGKCCGMLCADKAARI